MPGCLSTAHPNPALVIPISVHLEEKNLSFVEDGAMSTGFPPALVVDDERSPGVAQAGVVLAGLVPGAEHLRVELEWEGQGQSLSLQVATIPSISFMLRAAASRDISFEGHENCLSLAMQRCKQMICGAEYGCDCLAGGQCH